MTRDKHCVITLTTDFGMEDGNVGVMKGVIYGINPDVRLVDLSHDIAPQNIAAAAYVLRRAYTYFPQGTIHVVVVDPGVGSERLAIAVQSSQAFFVAPDNGVLTYVLRELREKGEKVRIINLINPTYWLPEVSNVFHGRDIFAPVAAHLSLGVGIDLLGEEIGDVVMIAPLLLERGPGKIKGQLAHIDHFGNLLTNIPESDMLSLGDGIMIRVAEGEIRGLSKTFAQGQDGNLIAYIDSSGHLAIAVVNGSAQQLLKCHVADSIEVTTSANRSLQQEAL